MLAIGLVGTMQSNAAVAGVLHDECPMVRRFASDALWELWLRGGTPDQNLSLQQAVRKKDVKAARAALDDLHRLLTQAPVGEAAPITVLREGRKVERTVAPAAYPDPVRG